MKNIDKTGRSLIFWMWNDTLDRQEILRQIQDFHRQHIDGVFIHVMPDEFRKNDFHGGMPGYLSEKYFEMFAFALECLKKYGIKLWIYDEGGWPSGTVNKRIPAEHPELRMHRISMTGEIQELVSVPDLLNHKSTELFISMVHEEYKKRFADDFGKTIPGIFTDEPYFGVFNLHSPEKFLPWSPVLAERFKEVKKYDLKDAAMQIFQNNDPQVRQDFCEVWHSLMIDNFMLPIRDWCHANNLLFTGHFNGDDLPENMRNLLASDIFTLLDCFDVPGCDAIWRQIHPLQKETDFSRIISSAAGSKMTVSESFGVYGADLSLAEMKWIAGMQAIAGIRLVIPMAAHYSNRGSRHITTDSNLYGSDPRWEFYKYFADFSCRLSKVFDRTLPVVKARVPFPVTALRRGETDGRDVFEKGLRLAAKQITYDYAPDAPDAAGEIPSDLQLAAPCPALRTRHLKSPRGERFILVNSSMETITCRFAAPDGFNVWYDPATGKRTPAVPDAGNMLSLTLPFAAVAVLLNIPGRRQQHYSCQHSTGDIRRLPLEFKFDRAIRAFTGSMNGLTEVPPPEVPDKDFCGTLRYSAKVSMQKKTIAKLILPQAQRAVLTVSINGSKAAVLPWAPYQCPLELPAGETLLSVDVTTTAAPGMYSAKHKALVESENLGNSYHNICMAFEKIFPDEKPLAEAFLEY